MGRAFSSAIADKLLSNEIQVLFRNPGPFTGVLQAQEFNAAKADSIVNAGIQAQAYPGAQLLVFKKDRSFITNLIATTPTILWFKLKTIICTIWLR